MSASTSDKFKKGVAAFSTTLASQKNSGASSCSLSDATGVPTDTGIHITVGRVDSAGTRTPSTKAIYAGTLSGTTVSNLTLVEGTDQTHAAGTVVEVTWNAKQWNDAVDGILAQHAQDGTHTGITATSITNSGTTSLTGALTVKSYDGWITDTHTWTYASGATTNQATFTVAGVDLTGVYNVGDKVKFTQTTVKYGIIVKLAFSTDTTVSIYMGTDYTMANATITSPAYSHDKSPVGFPLDPAKWTVSLSDTSNRSQGSPSGSTWYNLGSLSITIPIGVWRTYYEVTTDVTKSGTSVTMKTTLSTANNSESDTDFSSFIFIGGASGSLELQALQHREKTLTLASATPYYLNAQGGGAPATIAFRGDNATTYIRAVCAYL